MGPPLIRMSKLKSTTLALLMAVTLLAPLTASAGGVAKEYTVDFTVTNISIGNASIQPMQWEQPSGLMKDYYLRSTTLPIQVTFKQAGNSLQTTNGMGFIQIWHPVGIMVAEWNYSLSLSSGQEVVKEVVWTAPAAHSVLSENGTLSGGYIVRGVTDAGVMEGNPSNDIVDEEVPISIYYDQMETGACGDNDGDSVSDCSGATYGPALTFTAAGYEAGTDTPDGTGPWQQDTSSGFAGSKHWRHSVPGQDYVSNGNDQLHWGWFVPQGQSCEDPGHGLGYGTTANDVIWYSGQYCKVSISGGSYISMQLATAAWGGLGANDEVALEARSAGNIIAHLNLSEQGLSGVADDWKRVIWDVGANTSTQVFSISYHFMSDNSGATGGIHVDEFALFGVEKVNEYTISVDCDNPETGYLVIPADPLPPALHCTLTNNGYREVSLQILSGINNDTWMNFHSPIRIDSNNINDHDYSVPLNPLKYNETTEFWVNLSIPAGADIQSLEWNVSVLDYMTGEDKFNISIPLSVGASYSAEVYHTGQIPAARIAPGESEMEKFTLTNTGNQMAYWNLNVFFNRSSWTSQHFRFLDSNINGSEIAFIQLQKGESSDVWVEFTTPDGMEPGQTEVTIHVQGQSPATAQVTRKIIIEVPQVHSLELVASEEVLSAKADGRTRTVEVEITNNGNAPEVFDLSLTSDWRLAASVGQDQTEEIGAFGDSTTILLILPMPYGIRADTYFLTLTATSQTNSSFSQVVSIELIVEDTYLLEVEDVDMSGQTFQGGQDAKTISFAITNNGNGYDQFIVEIDAPEGMTASIITNQQYDPNSPPSVPQGASVNVTIEYAFASGTNGLLELTVTARSEESGNVSFASGSATFQVGSQGWLDLTPAGMVTLDEDGWIISNLTIHNRHPANAQFITISVEPGEERKYASVRVVSNDASFVLNPDDKRVVSVKFSLTETQYLNLPEDEMTFNITVIATGDDDVSQTVIQVKVLRDPTDGSVDAQQESGLTIGDIAMFIVGGLIILALVVVLIKVIASTSREEDEILSLAGYQRQLEETYGNIPSAPDLSKGAAPLPVTDTVANSAYGGAAEIFEQQLTPAPVAAAQPSAAATLPAGAPPLPPGGLPDGWTMEQWTHYGAQYREQHGLT